MKHSSQNLVNRPPLRKFIVRVLDEGYVTDSDGSELPYRVFEEHEVVAHLVFDNNGSGEGLVFRRYYDDSVRTEKVAQFLNWQLYKEIEIVKE